MADNGAERLDRIERALEMLTADHEQFRQEHRQLLTAQVVLQDTMERLANRVDQLADRVDKLVAHEELQDRQIKALDDRVNALVSAIGQWLRKTPGP